MLSLYIVSRFCVNKEIEPIQTHPHKKMSVNDYHLSSTSWILY